VQRLAEEKKLRYLDMNKLNEMNDDKLKEDIQKELTPKTKCRESRMSSMLRRKMR